jgi:hypothetical protein
MHSDTSPGRSHSVSTSASTEIAEPSNMAATSTSGHDKEVGA